MSNLTNIPVNKEKKRPSVSSKCLLNIKSIITQNISLNTNNKNISSRSSTKSTLPPLPLVNSLISSDESINCLDNIQQDKSNLENLPIQQINTTNGHGPSKDLESSSEVSTCKNEVTKLPIEELSVKESNCESPVLTNNSEPSVVPPLPLNSSMYPFASSSYPNKKPLSFPVQSSNRINEEYLTEMHRIIASSNTSNETKPIELSIYKHRRSLPIHRFDSASPTISTVDDEEEEQDELPLNNSLVFVNSSLNLSVNVNSVSEQKIAYKSRLSEPAGKDRKAIHQTNQRRPAYYTRLPHSLRTKTPSFNSPMQSGQIRPMFNPTQPIRRNVPQFESVRTPIQKPSVEFIDCCQTETSPRQTTMEKSLTESDNRLNYFRDVIKIRQIMNNVSKRLVHDQNALTDLPIVDTHCHFDLIFDRLRIKHNNLTKYFNDYKEYYPSGLSLEFAIQVFWRPKQLTEKNWSGWFSKYLDNERVYGACGIHPHWSSAWNETSVEDLEQCLQHPKIVAIGEIGLDYGPKNTCSVHDQRRAFEGQLKLAAKWLKPIVIHSRNAYQDTFELLKQYLEADHKIHLHCFVGTLDDVELFTSYFKEIKFGFTPIITRYDFLHTVIQQIPLTKILSETDSPYFVPDELSTYSRCAHPGMVYSVVEMVAQLRDLPVYDVACQLRENARHLYGI